MASAGLHPDILNFDLTPIEHNGARQYKRVAFVLPLFLSGRDFLGETTTAEQCAIKALFDTIVAWPILGGCVRTSGEQLGKLTMLARVPSTYTQPRNDLMDVNAPIGNEAGGQLAIAQLGANSLRRDFFATERGLTLSTGMPAVMLKVTFLGNRIVMAFSFYEAISDNAFISQFFAWMSGQTWLTTGSESSTTIRSPLQPVPPAEVNRNMFSFYDWSARPIAQRTPNDRLVCRLVDFKKHAMANFIGRIRQTIDTFSRGITVTDDDYIIAVLWVAIISARFSRRKVHSLNTARLNILLPGEPHARRADERDWTYFGNSTVPTVAEVVIQNLVFAVNHPNSSFQDMAMCIYTVRGIAEAASAVRRAINRVDTHYVRQLMGLKQSVPPESDWAAYDRAINRNTTGVTFEDWSGFFTGKLFGIPHTTGRPLRILPCADDMEEGKIILLPQLGGKDVDGNEMGWSAWLCLEREVMGVVLGQLEIQDWIIGEGRIDMNTMGRY